MNDISLMDRRLIIFQVQLSSVCANCFHAIDVILSEMFEGCRNEPVHGLPGIFPCCYMGVILYCLISTVANVKIYWWSCLSRHFAAHILT